MKDFKIHIDDDLDIKSKQTLNDYWLILDGKFKYKHSEIIRIHSIRQGELTKLVNKHSHCEINHGNCRECNEVIMEVINLKSGWNSAMNNRIDICIKCIDELRRKRKKDYQDEQEALRKKRQQRFDKAVVEKEWMKLSEIELKILYELIINESKNKIYANVFNDNPHDKLIWRYVDKFQDMGFLGVIRNGTSVIEFEFDERINEAVINLFNTKTNLDKRGEPTALDYLSFSLSKKENKQTNRHPDYGGTFTLKRDVILSANEKYLYGGWIQTDGSINLKFTPLSNFQSNNIIQENLEHQPELVGEIIKNMFDENQNDVRELPTNEKTLGTLDSNFYDDEDDYIPW